MDDMRIRKYVIVGGGTAGWFSAAILAKALKNTGAEIELVESPHTPTIGVGEATIPSIVDVLQYLGIPLKDFIRDTQATFKLGIKFVDWHSKGEHYWHQFGYVGGKMDNVPFYQHWLKYHLDGGEYDFTDFSPSIVMAKEHKFFIANPQKPSKLSSSTYAFHFDAGLVAQYLAQFSVALGVKHTLAHISESMLNESGLIESLRLENNHIIEGDFFIDCSGQQGLLIGQALRVGLNNWQQYLPVDRAVTMQTSKMENLAPYTLSTAHEHGWRWQIPLQNRTGNGYVYCSDYCDDSTAQSLLENNVNGEAITEPRTLSFTTGKRDKIWYRNCLAVGLSSGFLEPLESTSINLIVKGMLDFVQSLPDKHLHQATIDEYNRLMDIEYECIRDFLVLHYCKSTRTDSPFWRMWQHAAIPDSLHSKLALFEEHGRLYQNDLDLFTADSWYAVLNGMKVRPKGYDPLVDGSDFPRTKSALPQFYRELKANVDLLLPHETYIAKLLEKG